MTMPESQTEEPAEPSESRSYRDPLGDAGLGGPVSLPGPLNPEEPSPEPDPSPPDNRVYPPVGESYIGFYQRFEPNQGEGRFYLAGAEGIVGAPVRSRAQDQQRQVLGLDGRVVGRVEGRQIAELNALEQDGWTVECRLAYSLYNQPEKRFTGELAWMAYDNRVEGEWQAIANFIKGISFRLSFGMHPDLQLSQEQFERVLRSNGQWDQTPELPPEPMPKGSISHKRRRGLGDWLTNTAIEHRIGCNIAVWVFLTAMLAVVLVYWVWPRLGL